MTASLQHILDKNGVMVIDGSMSTALENMGADLNNSLWTAHVLATRPEMVRQVHINYLRAGADCGITCSYQATIPGLMNQGYTRTEAEDLIRRAVTLFLDARDQWWAEEGAAAGRVYPLCLAGAGPYGAYLADGSELTGNYSVSDRTLYDFHAQRLKLLWEAGADLLLIETQPSLHEAVLAAQVAEELGADYWVSFSCRDRYRTNKGELIRDCARVLSSGFPHLRMIGVNCTKPEFIVSLVEEMKGETNLPIAVYPNSGMVYDPNTKTWSGNGGMDFEQYALRYMAAGASAVGGCCTTVEEQVRQVVRARDCFMSLGRPERIRP